jgi:uncharacterized protein with ParB-like and HNH nuclease domain
MGKDYLKILTDLDLENIESEEEDYASSQPEYIITTYPADFTLEIIAKKLETGEIIIPDFQRQFVWNQVQASKLIESFLIGLPVPAIFVYMEYEAQKKLLVDGQQRLKSIAYFFRGYFGEETKGKKAIFRLKGLSPNSKYFNKSFDDLDENEQVKLKDSVLRTFIIKQLSPDDDTSIYHIFERLNTGGTFLNNQEVRNCVYLGEFNDLIKNKLNLNKNWRQILGKETADKRMVDNELIIRFLSLTNHVDNYEKPLKNYISKFMKRHREPSQKFLQATENLFCETCRAIVEILEPKPFHIKRGLNAAVLDCVMSAFANNLSKTSKKNKDDIKNSYKELVKLLENQKLINNATTNVETVKKRFKLAEEKLFN